MGQSYSKSNTNSWLVTLSKISAKCGFKEPRYGETGIQTSICTKKMGSISSMRIASLALAFPFILLVSLQVAVALVPPAKTFKLVNRGPFQRYLAEYKSNFRALPFAAFPFQLCFYNTTPNAFTLAVGMGDVKAELGIKWVWDANRGRPVKENAVLSFGQDGNLALTESDGSVAWQTGTANKGVTALNLLPSGNLVLVDATEKIVWQSFDFPGDTLVPGQYLSYKGPSKLAGRLSAEDGSVGPYSFQIAPEYWALYYTVFGRPLPYFKQGNGFGKEFNETVEVSEFSFGRYRVRFMNNIIADPFYNATYSVARLGSDGNLYLFTFRENLKRLPWEQIAQYFVTEDFNTQSFCRLVTRCGKLGVCRDDQCVACPLPQGLTGWSRSCSPPLQPPCTARGAAAKYYTVVGVDQSLSLYGDGEGPMGSEDCRGRCSKDCNCLGFTYNRTTSRCFTTPFIGTLIAAEDSTHVFNIKTR